ncbi:MAG: hypothetical protein DRG59_07260 [Deltaproteobacteria bacterium]|nr:MAG: hypothetical protein DRG59_07260 [Deltaproteobacteria bacterium]
MYGLVDEIQDLMDPQKIERVILTHSHFDHVGGLAEIFQVASPDLYMHKVTRGYLDLHRPPFPEFFGALQKEDKIKYFKDGDVLEGDYEIRVLYTPGHTAGDICLYLPSAKALASGDFVLGADHQYGLVLSKPDEVCGGRMKDRIESLKRLLSLEVKTLLPGHGSPVIENGYDQIKIQLLETFRIEDGRDSEKPWLRMAKVLSDLGDTAGAIECCKMALKTNRDCPEAKDMIARLDSENV